jgi:hypothetical protein
MTDEPLHLDPTSDVVREITCDCCGKTMRYTERNLARLTDIIAARYPTGPMPTLNIGAVERSGVDLTDPAVDDLALRRVVAVAVAQDG